MMIRVERGKGQKDRYVMLSEQLLKILREWYRFARPTTWMFPGVIPGSHITREGVNDACELGLKRSGLTKPVTPQLAATRLCRSPAGVWHGLAHDPAADGTSLMLILKCNHLGRLCGLSPEIQPNTAISLPQKGQNAQKSRIGASVTLPSSLPATRILQMQGLLDQTDSSSREHLRMQSNTRARLPRITTTSRQTLR